MRSEPIEAPYDDALPPFPEQRVHVEIPNTRPWVTYIIIGLTTLIWLGQAGMTYLTAAGIDWFAEYGIKANELIRAGQYWRFVTPIFLHGGIFHLGFNMYFLYSVGSRLEQMMGPGRYILLYLLAGMTGVALSFIFVANLSLGASGSLFGLLATEAVFIWKNRRWLNNWQEMLKNIAITIGINIVFGLSMNVDHFGHLGGFLGGLTFSWFAGTQWEMVMTAPNRARFDDKNNNLGATLVASVISAALFVALCVVGMRWGVPGIELTF